MAAAAAGAAAWAEGKYHAAAKAVAGAITHKDAPKVLLGGLAAYGLYSLLSSVPTEHVEDVTCTGPPPPGASSGGGSALPEEPLPPSDDVAIEDIPRLVATMRQHFFQGKSRSFESRARNLDGLIRFFEEQEAAIMEALKADLGRPAFEALVYDVLIPLADIKRLRKNLRAHMAPVSVGQDLASFPASSALRPEPYGVALVLDTWNYPIMLGVLPLAGAIAAGNTAILKPSVVSRATAELLGRELPKYVDSDVVRVVGHTAGRDRHVLTALLACRTDKVFFTGSPKVGRIVYRAAAEHLTPVTLELGGKNPVLVAGDANVDLAAKRIVWGRMMNAGQQCIAPDYVLLDRAVAPAFYAACCKWVDTFYEGRPAEPGRVGRIVDAGRMATQVGILASHGGRVVCGGEYDEATRYVAPTVLAVPPDSPVLAGETFGPILMCVEVGDMREAARFVAAKEKPLSMYIFSESQATVEFLLQNTSAGGVTVNGTLMHVSHPELPFGGVGASGVGGGYHGKATFDAFTHYKPVLKRQWWPDGGLFSDLWVLYAPWDGLKTSVARMFL